MSAAVCVFILTCSAVWGSGVVSGALSAPTHVRLTSYNMNLVLRWDPPEGAPGGLLYTAQYRSKVGQSYKDGCVNTSRLACDLTELGGAITAYGTYIGRVRAALGANSSAWVETREFNLDENTTIGAPNVSLISNRDSIEVAITDPQFSISSVKETYLYATYNITYWRDGQEGKAKSITNVQQNRVVLQDLEVWTKYCVTVRIITTASSEASGPVCESTTSREKVPWVAAVVTFVVMAAAVALVVVAVVHRKRISHFLCPKDVLPQRFFKEDLMSSFHSSMHTAMQKSYPPEEVYHPISIDSPVEEKRPLEAAGTSCSPQPDLTVEL